MKAAKYTLSLIIIGSVALFAGCTVPVSCSIFNNTNSIIVINRIDRNGSEERIEIEPGQDHLFKECEYGRYTMIAGEDSYSFKMPSPSVPEKDYVEYKGTLFWGKRIVKIQLQSNFTMYLLKKEESFPLQDYSSQPEGFPIELKKRR